MACWWRRITPSPRPQESRGASRLTGLSQRREAAIEQALKAKIEQRRAAREAQAAADRRELEAFKEQFLNAAREVFALIDADGNGSLTKTEIVDAVRGPRPLCRCLRLAVAGKMSQRPAPTHWSTPKHRSPMTKRSSRSSGAAASQIYNSCCSRSASRKH